jgi:hypothetical protein
MLAHRREDVRNLNDAARVLMLKDGRLGDDALGLAEREFRVGDRVLCRRNNTRLHIRNGTRATVTAIDNDTLTLWTDSGAVRAVDSGYAAEHLEHGYALTGHAAQGATLERAFVLLSGQGALQEWGYVACSRARTETYLYLSEAAPERETHAREQPTPRATDRVARALSTSSAEPLASEQLRPTDEGTARVLAARQQRLEQTRTRAGERLAEAEAKLDQLGWRSHGKRGSDLRTEIAMQRVAIRLADEKLAEPMTTPAKEPQRREPDQREHARERTPQNRLRRRPLERSHSPERGRGIGIEL